MISIISIVELFYREQYEAFCSKLCVAVTDNIDKMAHTFISLRNFGQKDLMDRTNVAPVDLMIKIRMIKRMSNEDPYQCISYRFHDSRK